MACEIKGIGLRVGHSGRVPVPKPKGRQK
jgi:hypothetical protein